MSEKKEKRTRIIGIRLSPQEYKTVNKEWKTSGCRQLSEYARTKLFDQPIIKSFRNQSLDDLMLELIQLRKSLAGITVNFEQATKKLSSADSEADSAIWSKIQSQQGRQLQDKVDEIKRRINLIADKWLQ